MRTILAAALVLLATAAQAADMPVKANPLFTGYPYNGNGFYYGLNALGEATKTTVPGAAGTNGDMFAAGAALGVTAGYQWGRGTTFYALEAMVNYQNVGTANPAATGAVSSRTGFEVRGKFGGPLASVMNFLPGGSPVFPGLPVVPVSGNTHPYLMVGVRADDVSAQFALDARKKWEVRPSVGAGVLQQLNNGIVADAWVEYNPQGTGFLVGGPGTANANMGRGFRVGAALLY